MKTNQHLEDIIYKQVGEEIARNELSPGAMAKSIAEAKGNKALVESLYAKFRHHELMREFELQQVKEKQSNEDRIRREKEQIEEERREGIYRCPKCDYHGKLKKKPRGSALLIVTLLLLSFLTGSIAAALLVLLYAIFTSGSKGVCLECKTVVAKKL